MIAGAEAELLKVAERLSAPVATTISGKGSISELHPLAVGVVGSNGGTPETRAIVDQADLVVFIGCRAGSVTTERWRHPAPGKTKVVHLDVDPAVFGANYSVDVPLVGDAKLTLAALNEALATLQRPLDARAVQKAKEDKFAKFHALAVSDDKPIKPERVVSEVAQALDPDAIVVADAGTPCPYFSAYYQVQGTGRRFFSNRAHGALGLLDVCGYRRAVCATESEMRSSNGRRQFWFYLWRTRNGGALSAADNLYSHFQRYLWVDQGGAKVRLWRALLLR